MTTEELKHKFNEEFGLNKWPEIYEVDADTYANVCQYLINRRANNPTVSNVANNIIIVPIMIGRNNNGILFKGVELILKS